MNNHGNFKKPFQTLMNEKCERGAQLYIFGALTHKACFTFGSMNPCTRQNVVS
jgi:hypothetical protein